LGTRSLTFIYDMSKKPILCLYGQFDGEPKSLGLKIAEFINSKNMRFTGESNNEVNGMGCLAAQLVAHLKTKTGCFYIQQSDIKQDCAQEYEYHIRQNSVNIYQMYGSKLKIFGGTWRQFLIYCKLWC
jgi:hypothetical protein